MTPDEEHLFLAFARERSSALFRSALLLSGGDWHRAEDLVQETLGRLYRFWPDVAAAANPAGYAHTVLVRVFLSGRRRRSAQEPPTRDIPDVAAIGTDPARTVALFDALQRLSPADRSVLVLRFYVDRSVEQVALDLHRSPGAVRAQTHRALARLRTLLGPELADLTLL